MEPSTAAGEDSFVWHPRSEKCPGRKEEIERKKTAKYEVAIVPPSSCLSPCVSALCKWTKRRAPRATLARQAAAAIAGDVCRKCESILHGGDAPGNHNMAVPGVAREELTSLAEGGGQQHPAGAGTALGGSQASRAETAEEKVSFFN